MKIENLIPLFIDDKVVAVKSPEILRRIDSAAGRWYYICDGEEDPYFYLSTTSFIGSFLPNNKVLTDWRINMADLMGKEESVNYVGDTATYGTILHRMIAFMTNKGGFNYLFVVKEIHDLFIEYGVDNKYTQAWENDLIQDMLAWCQFIIDHKVRVLAVEYPITGDGIATCIDIVCEITVEEKGFWGEVYLSGEKKGLPKESKKEVQYIAILDIKSSRKGFYESHELQLELCKEMWNARYAGTPYEVVKVFNWRPKEWRDTPTFHLKDQTENKFVGWTDKLLDMGRNLYNLFNIGWSDIVPDDFELGESPVFTKRSISNKIKEHERENRVKA